MANRIKLKDIRNALKDVDFRDSTAMMGAIEIDDIDYCRNKVIDTLKQYPYLAVTHDADSIDTILKQCIQLLVLARILNGADEDKNPKGSRGKDSRGISSLLTTT